MDTLFRSYFITLCFIHTSKWTPCYTHTLKSMLCFIHTLKLTPCFTHTFNSNSNFVSHNSIYVHPSNFLASCRLMYHLSDHSIAFLCSAPIQDFLLTQKFFFGFFFPPPSLFFICDDLSETRWAGFPLKIYINLSKYIEKCAEKYT